MTIIVEENALQDTDIAEMSEADLAAHLAGMSDLQFDKCRKEYAKKLDISIATLRKIRKSQHNETDNDGAIADELVNMVKAIATLFFSTDSKSYATFEQDGHKENWPIHSDGFRDWAMQLYYAQTGRVPSETPVRSAFHTLAGMARYDGIEKEIWLRAAPYEDGYVLDLCQDNWQVVYVSPRGYQVLKESPVKFYRTANMQPLPVPAESGDIELLWQYVNIKVTDRPLLLAWILECYRPDTPFAIAEFIAGQGHAKSDSQEKVRQVVDPNRANLRTSPNKIEDIYVSAGNNWVISFNNVSHLNPAQQDALCTLSTGGGFSTRTFYSNTGETVIDVKRPVILNGISSLATQPDLVDRVLHFKLPALKEYIEVSKLNAGFEKDLPSIFAGILQLFADTLAMLPDVALHNAPRMVDFTRLGEAMFVAMGEEGSFTERFVEKRTEAMMVSLESSPIAMAVITYMQNNHMGYDNGTFKDLLDALSIYHTPGEPWPKSPRGLADALRRHLAGMKVVGVEVLFDEVRHNDGFHVSLRKIKNDIKKNVVDIDAQSTRDTPETPESAIRVHCEPQSPTYTFHANEKTLSEDTPSNRLLDDEGWVDNNPDQVK